MTKTKPLTDQLREHIRQADFSQRQFAFRVGTDPAVLSRFLNGRGGLSMEVIDNVGKLLGLTLVAETPKKTIARRTEQ